MLLRRLFLWTLIVAAPVSAAVSREMQELQRDVAQLQDLVKALQTSVNGQLANLQGQVKVSADAAGQANAAVAAVQRSLEQLLRDQEVKLVPPMAAMGTRMDQVSGALGTMQQAVSDLTVVMTKLQTQLSDLNMAVKAIQPPAAAAPADAPPITAIELFKNADNDRRTGKLELAAQEFADYLKWYATTASAGDAQYYLGSIHYSQKNYESAVQDFDAVLKNYPDAQRAPEALFYKASSLTNLGRASEAGEVYKELRRRYPSHDLAKQSLKKQ